MKTYSRTIPEYKLKKIPTNLKKCKITSSKDARDYISQFYFDDIEIYESFFALLLNRANNTIGYVKVSQGGISGTIADPVLIAKYAIESLASGIIIAHNHPTGNIQPSDNDIQLTKSIKKGLEYFQINLLDHVILSGDHNTKTDYYSFADENIM